MIFDRFFRPKAVATAGQTLYAAVVAQSRTPGFYTDLAVPDTVEGRFELYSLHVVLLLDRLKGQGPQAADSAQALFDTYLRALDNALREMGVGDLSVGKKMRKLGEAFYGRVKSYEAAFGSLPETAGLQEVLERTVYDGVEAAPAPRLADYVVGQRQALAAQALADLLKGRVVWTAP